MHTFRFIHSYIMTKHPLLGRAQMFQLFFGIERFIFILNVIMCMLPNTYVQPYTFLLHFCVRNSMNTETICIETLFFNFWAKDIEL
jgi:hypothetical protein